MDGDDRQARGANRLGAAGWIAIVVLFGLLGWAGWYAVLGWNALSGVGISGFGWAIIVIGVIFTIALGAGLMALMFYSSRKDMDR